MDTRWLDWAKRLQAISQTGLAYAGNPFDKERYEEVGRIASEMMSSGSETDTQIISELFAQEQGYATPKVDVRGVVFREDKLLLVQEQSDGGWTLPGGFADVGDSPGESVVREILEESGYLTRAVKLLAVYDRNKHGHVPPFPFHIYKLFFLCELEGGSPRTSPETSAVEFFAEDGIPRLSLGRVTPDQVARLFEHHRHPEWPADFD